MKTQTQVKTYDQIRADIAAIRARIARDKAKPRIVASSLVDDREKSRQRAADRDINKAVQSLTRNLPSDPGLNPNWSYTQLIGKIAEHANNSALESGVIFVATKEGNLELETTGVNLKVNFQAFEAVAEKLYKWSGVSHKMINQKGERAGAVDFYNYFILAVIKHQVERNKLKPSSYYLDKLVENSIKVELQYQRPGTRELVKGLLLQAVVKIGAPMGFERDARKKFVYLDCWDNRIGSTELSKETLLPYFKRIIEGSTVAGKFKSVNDPKDLLDGFVAAMPRGNK